MGRCGATSIVIALAGASLIAAPGAVAGTEVGNDCLANGFASDFTLLQLEKAGGNALPLSAPGAGVVTKWKVNSGLASILAENLRVFRATGKANEFQAIADSRSEPILPGTNAFDTRIPVRAGDRFGAYAASPSGALYCNTANPADVMGALAFDGAVGSTQTFTSNPSFQVAVSAVVERDEDGDGYGDETQDRCPKGRAYHGECPRVRLNAIAKVKQHAIVLLVTAGSEAFVDVYGQVGWGFKPAAKPAGRRARPTRLIVALNGGRKHIGTGATTRFKIPLPKAVLRRLGRLAPDELLTAKITAAATDLAGRKKNLRLRVKLKGRADAA
jgi:hypothetical protein